MKTESSGGKVSDLQGSMRKSPPYRSLLFSFFFTLLLIACSIIFVPAVDPAVILAKLLIPISRLLILILLGLVIGQIIESTGWTNKLAVLARPMFRFGNLGSHCSAAFTTAFISGVASNAMLFGYYKDGYISRTQLYLANFINHLPAYFLHLPTTFFIVFPLTGRAGLIYFGITLTATLLRTTFFVIYGHFLVAPVQEGVSEDSGAGETQKRKKQSIQEALRSKIPARITTIVIWVLPIYTAVFLLNQLGLFARANQLLSSYFVTGFIPIEALSVVILSFAAEFTSGFAAAGALLDSGVITVKQTVAALIIGNVLAFPLRALRHQLPRYIGIFSPKMGTQILLMGQAFRIVSLIVVTTLYYCLF